MIYFHFSVMFFWKHLKQVEPPHFWSRAEPVSKTSCFFADISKGLSKNHLDSYRSQDTPGSWGCYSGKSMPVLLLEYKFQGGGRVWESFEGNRVVDNVYVFFLFMHVLFTSPEYCYKNYLEYKSIEIKALILQVVAILQLVKLALQTKR